MSKTKIGANEKQLATKGKINKRDREISFQD